MGCYLCAYQSTSRPKRPSPLPAGSPASPTDPLGTCAQCSVAACSGHGSLYGQYLCAMCRGAAAIAGVVTPAAPGGPGAAATRAAMEVARQVGAEAGDDQQQRVHAALIRVTIDAAQAREPQDGVAPAGPNLVWDLGGAIADALGESPATLPAVRDRNRTRLLAEVPGPVEISLDGVAGAVRGQFGGMPPLHVTRDGAVIATGALVMAFTVADDPDAADFGRSEVVNPSEVEIRPPWQVSHPILLSPAAWLLATAYHLA